jgi:hypothetical protein
VVGWVHRRSWALQRSVLGAQLGGGFAVLPFIPFVRECLDEHPWHEGFATILARSPLYHVASRRVTPAAWSCSIAFRSVRTTASGATTSS